MVTSDKRQVVARHKDGTEIGFSQELRDDGPFLFTPEEVERYGKLIPDFGDRAMKMAEQRQESELKYRDEVSRQNHAQITLGQLCVVAIGLCGYGTAVYALVRGYPWVCGGIGTIVSICLVTLVAVSRRRINGGEKRDIITKHD